MKKYSKHYFASCPVGFEFLVEEDLQMISRNKSTVIRKSGGILFESYNEDAIKLILESKIVSKVYKLLYSFPIEISKDLYTQACKIAWDKVFDLNQDFFITSILDSKQDLFDSSMYSSQVLKDAIADTFRKKYAQRPNLSKDGPIKLLLVLEQGTIYLYIAMTGSLGERGYRHHSYELSIKENLAAGLLRIFNSQSQYFQDIFCGSGTLIFEEYLRRNYIPAQYNKILKNQPFLFESLTFFKKDPYLIKNFVNYKEEFLQTLSPPANSFFFEGSDINPTHFSNKSLFFQDSKIKFIEQPFQKSKIKGDIISNIPYKNFTHSKEVFSIRSPYKLGFICSFEQSKGIQREHKSFFFKNGPLKCVLITFKSDSSAR